MPVIVTTIHDPAALVATCRRLNLPLPRQGCTQLHDREVSGWILSLHGLRHPILCDTLTGLIAYHPCDNAFGRYARIMRFLFRVYDIQAILRQARHRSRTPRSIARMSPRRTLAG